MLNPTAETLEACNHFDIAIYSDLYKDVYGCRPRGENLSIYTAEELDVKWNNLCEMLSEEIDREKERELQAENDFTDLVYTTMNTYGITSARALEWMGVRKESFYGWESVCYEYGLPYNFKDQLEILAAE